MSLSGNIYDIVNSEVGEKGDLWYQFHEELDWNNEKIVILHILETLKKKPFNNFLECCYKNLYCFS